MEMNGSVIGIIMKELVRRAIVIARSQITSFEVTAKLGYGGDMNDVFTNADKEAQESYVKLLQECFPEAGILGEEDSLVIPTRSTVDIWFAVDPIDGTRAFIRRQSHGVGSMIALVIDDIVEAAYVGDINTQEIFGYRPNSDKAWRITDLEVYERLDANPPDREIGKMYLILRERESKYCRVSQKTINMFESVLIDGGSIGIWAARLWKREVGALLLAPSWETPWDSMPVIGISKKLGYVFLKPSGNGWEIYEPMPFKEKYRRKHDTLIIHKNHVHQLAKHMAVR